MTGEINNNHSATLRVLREILRWGIALAIGFVLARRLFHDWPTVRAALNTIQWQWIIVSMLPAFLYFTARVQAWRSILRRLAVTTPWWPAAAIFMKSEIIRYIPGTVWAFLGRVVQGKRFAPNRMTIATSLLLEMLILACVSLGLSALLLVGYPRYVIAARPLILLLVVLLCLLPLLPIVARRGVVVLARILRRQSSVAFSGSLAVPYFWITLSWTLYALFHIGIAFALHLPMTAAHLLVFSGITLLAWFLGFINFLTPSGLGVREGVVVLLLAPYISTTDAIVFAVVSRVLLTLIEAVTLAVFNGVARARTTAIPAPLVTQ